MFNFNPDVMQIDGGGEGLGLPAPVTLTASQGREALRKLQSGQALTNAERAYLGMSPIAAPTSPNNWNEGREELDRVAAEARAAAAAARAAVAEAGTAAQRVAAEKAAADAKARADAAERQAAANAAATLATSNASASNPLIKSLQDQIAALTKQISANATTSTQYNERMGVYASMADRFNKYGLTGLANKIKELAIAGATEATITLQLMETPEYQQRFAANADRIKRGLSALTPAEYVNVEDSYRQVLRAYGLKQFDNDAYVRQFIANDMSPTELSNRVVTAVQRVQNADPALVNQLKQFYGIGAPDMVAYVLDPEQQFQKIERQIAASEIGVAAGRQGLRTGVSVAEQLAAQGVTEAEARKGYSTIADILPTAEKLSDIYGTTLDEYRQDEAEQEVFNSLASAQRKRQRLTAREVASFGGASGINKTSLTVPSVGQY